ncbi:MAG: hypothetical protein ACRD0K_03720 [Egibacteraceae bacterium]
MNANASCKQERPHVARSMVREVPDIEPDGVLGRVAECFPLGLGLDPVDLGTEPPSGPETRPFRYLTPVSTDRVSILDLSEVSYDPKKQMSTIRGELLIVATTKQQTNYATKTKEDRQEFEDVEEDTVTD